MGVSWSGTKRDYKGGSSQGGRQLRWRLWGLGDEEGRRKVSIAFFGYGQLGLIVENHKSNGGEKEEDE